MHNRFASFWLLASIGRWSNLASIACGATSVVFTSVNSHADAHYLREYGMTRFSIVADMQNALASSANATAIRSNPQPTHACGFSRALGHVYSQDTRPCPVTVAVRHPVYLAHGYTVLRSRL